MHPFFCDKFANFGFSQRPNFHNYYYFMMKNQNLEYRKNLEKNFNETSETVRTNHNTTLKPTLLESTRWSLQSKFLYSTFFSNLLFLFRCTKIMKSRLCNPTIQPNSPRLSIRYWCKSTATLRRIYRAMSMKSEKVGSLIFQLSAMANWNQSVIADSKGTMSYHDKIQNDRKNDNLTHRFSPKSVCLSFRSSIR